MEEKEKDTNASASAYGWAFQVGAGIVLMLDNIKEFTELKIEGKLEDIEITLPSGKIYAQAKSVTQIGNQSTASSNLRKSLGVLSFKSKKTDSIKLIYITNIANPLSSQYPSAFLYGHSYDYSTLPEKDKAKIIKYAGEDFQTEKFELYILNFFGNGKNKFDSVKEKIAEFLQNAIDDPSYSSKLLDNWFTTFLINCTDKPDQDKTCSLTKRQIILPVMLIVIESSVSEKDFKEVCNFDDLGELEREFRNVIDRQTCNYEFVSGVIGDFLSANKTSKEEFIKTNWKNYEDGFSYIKEDVKREALIKYILLIVITKRNKINKIKEAANL